jgi:hypothetical protein
MAGEAKVFLGTTKTLASSGASTANNVITQASDASYTISSDGGNYPDAEFVAGLTFGTAPTENTTVDVYARELSIDSTNSAQVPESSAHRPRYIGSFVVNNISTVQYQKFIAYNVPNVADYYIYNNGTGQTLSAGWTLKVTPRTIGPA